MAIYIRRREFIVALLGGAAVSPLAARAQPTLPVIGFLYIGSEIQARDRGLVTAFQRGLNEIGFVGDQNVAIEYRWANGQYDRLSGLAAELVQRPVAVIATVNPFAALAAKQATKSIPIVFSIGSDPVKDGLVASLSRPGGNITGGTFFANLLDTKRLSLLHQLVPNAKVVAVLINPKNVDAQLEKRETQEAARALGLKLIFAPASSEPEIDEALARVIQEGAAALHVAGDVFLSNHADQIAQRAARYRLPTSFILRGEAAAGGLMSYGADQTDTLRQAGNYVGRILRGEKPGDLPVQLPTKFELVINMKTAKALGIEVPISMQMLANEVIE
jgi:putative ABC transport system substrate-binding protein